MDQVLAATRPLGPVATAVVAGILVTAGVVVVVGYLAIRIRWRRDARRKRSGEQ